MVWVVGHAGYISPLPFFFRLPMKDLFCIKFQAFSPSLFSDNCHRLCLWLESRVLAHLLYHCALRSPLSLFPPFVVSPLPFRNINQLPGSLQGLPSPLFFFCRNRLVRLSGLALQFLDVFFHRLRFKSGFSLPPLPWTRPRVFTINLFFPFRSPSSPRPFFSSSQLTSSLIRAPLHLLPVPPKRCVPPKSKRVLPPVLVRFFF